MTRTPLARAALRRELEGWLRTGNAGLAVLSGPVGSGRTYLARQLTSGWQERDIEVGWVVASVALRPVSLGALAPLLSPSVTAAQGSDLLVRVSEALAGASPGRPRVLVVDDAHLLDDTSIAVLAHLLTVQHLAVLVTVTSGAVAPAGLTDLIATADGPRLALRPLDRAEVVGVASELLGGEMATASVVALHRHSAGLPVLLEGYIRGSVAGGNLREHERRWVLAGTPQASAGLRRWVVARIATLPIAERDALEVLSLASPLAFAMLEHLAGTDELDGLERTGLLAVVRDRRRVEARIAHPLYAEVIAGAMTSARRRMWFRRLLSSAAARSTGRRRSDPATLAVWQLEAGNSPDPAHALLAAEQALRAGTADLAGWLADAGYASDPGRAAAIRGRARLLQRRFDAADQAFAEAATHVADQVVLAGLVRERAELAFFHRGDPAAALALLEDASACSTEPEAQDVLASQQALFASLTGAPARALDIGTRLEGRPTADPNSVIAILVQSSLASMMLGRFAEVRRQLRRAHEAVAIVTDTPTITSLQLRATATMAGFYEQGAIAGTYQQLQTDLTVAAHEMDAEAIGFLGSVATHLGAFIGDVAHAEKVGFEAVAWLEQHDPVGMRDNTQAHLAYLAALAGSPSLAKQRLGRLDDRLVAADIRVRFGVSLARLRCAAWVGERDAAGELVRRELSSLRSFSPVWAMLLVHEAVRIGIPTQVADVAADVTAGVEGPLAALVSRHLRAALDEDGLALEEVAGEAGALGLPLVAAETAVRAARAYRRVRDVVRETRMVFAAQAHAAAAPGAAVLGLAEQEWPLTDREAHVARLAATGRSDRSIADELGLATRTVSNHLGRVYGKLDLHGRTELAVLFGDGPRPPSTDILAE